MFTFANNKLRVVDEEDSHQEDAKSDDSVVQESVECKDPAENNQEHQWERKKPDQSTHNGEIGFGEERIERASSSNNCSSKAGNLYNAWLWQCIVRADIADQIRLAEREDKQQDIVCWNFSCHLSAANQGDLSEDHYDHCKYQ